MPDPGAADGTWSDSEQAASSAAIATSLRNFQEALFGIFVSIQEYGA
jgi:hypothetical protein